VVSADEKELSRVVRSVSSADYWEGRYRSGGNSGKGSYGRLAVYKAHLINCLVHREKIETVVEFGSGDGHQASLFAIPHYTGVDVSSHAVDRCREAFGKRPGWDFVTAEDFVPSRQYDLSLSLDVVYHLFEDAVFEQYMHRLFAAATRFVLVYSSDHEDPDRAVHVRHRKYSDWVRDNIPGWRCLRRFEQPYPRIGDEDPAGSSFAFFRLYGRTNTEVGDSAAIPGGAGSGL